MRKLFLVLFFACVFFARAEVTEEEGVLVLTDSNFDDVIKQHEYLLVEFYAPWCGHCKKLAPEYAKAAQVLRPEGLYLAKVDATIHKELGSRFGIEGFPTLKFFVNGNPVEYTGGRTESDIVNWIRKKTGPASKELNSVEEVENFHKGSEVALVLFGDNAALFDIYERFAKSNDDISFAHSRNADVLSHYNVQPGTVVIFKKFDEGRNDLTEAFTEDSLREFVNTHSSPLVMKFDEKAAQLVFGKNVPGLFLYRDRNAENTAQLDEIVTNIAKKYKGKLQVLTTGITEGLETRLAEYIGVTAEDLPTLRIHDTRVDLKKYNLDGEITAESAEKFVEDWLSGSLRPHLKSEEVPATQDEPVYVLVGKEFDKVVLDSEKDVLVEFYAPWCGHCKSLAPIYDELATKLKHNKNLIIAKMDATANETEHVQIQGFPTIKFWPAGNKSAPMDYNGDRTVDGFIQFLTQHATNKVETAAPSTDDAKTDL